MQLQQMSVMGLANLPVQVAVAPAPAGISSNHTITAVNRALGTNFIDSQPLAVLAHNGRDLLNPEPLYQRAALIEVDRTFPASHQFEGLAAHQNRFGASPCTAQCLLGERDLPRIPAIEKHQSL